MQIGQMLAEPFKEKKRVTLMTLVTFLKIIWPSVNRILGANT